MAWKVWAKANSTVFLALLWIVLIGAHKFKFVNKNSEEGYILFSFKCLKEEPSQMCQISTFFPSVLQSNIPVQDSWYTNKSRKIHVSIQILHKTKFYIYKRRATLRLVPYYYTKRGNLLADQETSVPVVT